MNRQIKHFQAKLDNNEKHIASIPDGNGSDNKPVNSSDSIKGRNYPRKIPK